MSDTTENEGFPAQPGEAPPAQETVETQVAPEESPPDVPVAEEPNDVPDEDAVEEAPKPKSKGRRAKKADADK